LINYELLFVKFRASAQSVGSRLLAPLRGRFEDRSNWRAPDRIFDLSDQACSVPAPQPCLPPYLCSDLAFQHRL